MASELIFRGHEESSHPTDAPGYTPKPPHKPLARPLRYLLFALLGMAVASSVFLTAPSSSSASPNGGAVVALATTAARRAAARPARGGDGRGRVRRQPPGGPAAGARRQRDRGGQLLHGAQGERGAPRGEPRAGGDPARRGGADPAGGGPDLPPGVPGVARALQAQPGEDNQDQRDGHAQHAGPRQARRRAVPPHQHQRGVRRPAAAPPGGNLLLLGKRQPRRCSELLRRGQAHGGDADHGLPPRRQPRGEDRPDLQHVRAAHVIDDDRVVSNFVAQALRKEPLTVYGDGKQTRSFQYVSDLVEGLMKLMEGEHVGPFNLGNPGQFTMLELARWCRRPSTTTRAPASSSVPTPPTTRTSGSPTSPAPSSCWVGSPRCRSSRSWYTTSGGTYDCSCLIPSCAEQT